MWSRMLVFLFLLLLLVLPTDESISLDGSSSGSSNGGGALLRKDATVVISGGEEEHYLMGYMSYDADADVNAADEASFMATYVKHSFPKQVHDTAFEWKRYAQEAKEKEVKGHLHDALQIYLILLENNFLAERMMDEERYELHVSIGKLMVEMGMLSRAQSIFFAATSLVHEPSEAYFNLARLMTHQGKLDDAVLHYKHHLFFQSDDLESLQNLGCLLVIKGSINEGRHYLLRAQSILDRDVRRFVGRVSFTAQYGKSRYYHWLMDYLLSSLSSKPRNTTASDFSEDESLALLHEFTSKPQPMNGRTHFDLGTALYDLGLWTEAMNQMKIAKALLRDSGSSSSATPPSSSLSSSSMQSILALRLALDSYPVFSTSGEASHMLGKFRSGTKELLSSTQPSALIPPQDLFDAHQGVASLLAHITTAGDVEDFHMVSEVLGRFCPELSMADGVISSSSSSTTGIVFSAGLISGFLYDHPVGLIALSLLRHLVEAHAKVRAEALKIRGVAVIPPILHLTIYRFPGPYDHVWRSFLSFLKTMAASSSEHVVVSTIMLPYDWFLARSMIKADHDVIFFSDSLDTETRLLAHSRLAPQQVSFDTQGLSTGLLHIDYHLTLLPSYGLRVYTEQVVVLQGLSYMSPLLRNIMDNVHHHSRVAPFSAYRNSSSSSSDATMMKHPPRLRYEFYGHVFFQHQHIFPCVLATVSTFPSIAMDAALHELLSQDENAVVVFIVPKSPASVLSIAHQQLLHRLRSSRGTLSRRIHLLPPLNEADRYDLLAISSALLDPFPYPSLVAVMEAVVTDCPVVSMTQSGGLGKVIGLSSSEELTTISNPSTYAGVAARLALDPSFRTRIVTDMRKSLNQALSGGITEESTAAKDDLLVFLYGLAGIGDNKQQHKWQQ